MLHDKGWICYPQYPYTEASIKSVMSYIAQTHYMHTHTSVLQTRRITSSMTCTLEAGSTRKELHWHLALFRCSHVGSYQQLQIRYLCDGSSARSGRDVSFLLTLAVLLQSWDSAHMSAWLCKHKALALLSWTFMVPNKYLKSNAKIVTNSWARAMF